MRKIIIVFALLSSPVHLNTSQEDTHHPETISGIKTTEPYFITIIDRLILQDCKFKHLNLQGSGKVYLHNVKATFLNALKDIEIIEDSSSHIMFKTLNLKDFSRLIQADKICIRNNN